MERSAEVRRLLQMSPEQVIEKAGDRLVVCDDLEALHRRFAETMAELIRTRNAAGLPTRMIVPVGPTGQYPFFADIVRREGISLANCRLFFMDEYCDEAGKAVTEEHPLSFKAEARRKLLDRLDPGCGLRSENVVFPSDDNIGELTGMVEVAGGLDACFGGIGIHGHVAFNEPEPGVAQMGPRKVQLNNYTVTINAVRAHVGGNLECFPREAFTIGMREILSAYRIHLYCRNGYDFDWANTVLRLALFGAPGDDYPVTHIRDKDYVITTDRHTLATPENLL